MRIKKSILYILLIGILCLSFSCSYSHPITSELEVKPEAGECELVLKVSNTCREEITLNFTSSKQYDFIIKDIEGKTIWQWSEGKMFAQMIQQLNIPPGQEHTFTETWPYINNKTGAVIQPGVYMVQGILTAAPDPVETDWVEVDIASSYIETQASIKGRVRKILNKLYLLGENGIAYHIENPKEDINQLIDNNIEVTEYVVKPIPGTVDKKITIEEYNID